MTFYSQIGQDKWVSEFFNNKKEGYFIEIGAYHPINLSNSYYLESELDWRGICVEASKSLISEFKDRKCILVNKAIYKDNTTVKFLTRGWDGHIMSDGPEEVEAITMEVLLKENNCPKCIDYISLDIEGGEYNALLGFPFAEYEAILWSIEHNVNCGGDSKYKVFNFMTEKGYKE